MGQDFQKWFDRRVIIQPHVYQDHYLYNFEECIVLDQLNFQQLIKD